MKNNIFRTLFFLLLIYAGLSGPLWLFVAGASVYILLYLGLEIIILAAAIDIYFGYASDEWFIYTISISAVLFITQWIKPRLSVYNQ